MLEISKETLMIDCRPLDSPMGPNPKH